MTAGDSVSNSTLRFPLAAATIWVAFLGMSAGPAEAQASQRADRSPCEQLCGSWYQTEPDNKGAGVALEKALAKYRDDDAERYANAQARCPEEPCATPGPDPEDDFLNPRATRRNWRPTRAEMREELQPKTKMPDSLALSWEGGVMSVQADGGSNRYRPGESYVRVDAWGSAEVESHWRDGRFEVRENYGRGRRNLEIYRYDPKSLVLVVERRLDRPGLATVVFSRTYSRRVEAGQGP
jgi:hypothetical protein